MARITGDALLIPKKLRLMVFIITVIWRARWIIGVVLAKASRLPVRISGA